MVSREQAGRMALSTLTASDALQLVAIRHAALAWNEARRAYVEACEEFEEIDGVEAQAKCLRLRDDLDRAATALDAAIRGAPVGDGTAQKEMERLRTELGEARSLIEQQDRDLEKLRTALREAVTGLGRARKELGNAAGMHYVSSLREQLFAAETAADSLIERLQKALEPQQGTER
jgi:tetratricopeptide (TPR) repeat protein